MDDLDLAAIGNCTIAALIDRQATIAWMCFPRFDGDPLFSALLDGGVEPAARGLRLGERLVAECERFARERGYRRIVLWTDSNLAAARGIYRKAGYRLTGSEPHRSFGPDVVGESWELLLT